VASKRSASFKKSFMAKIGVFVGEERPFLDGLGSRPALFILHYVELNPPFQALSTTAAAPKKKNLASARLAPIVALASTSFANPAFSYLAVVRASALRGVQSPEGEGTEISLL
jgi:hypothetical protein